jgi:type 1 glutamine amidotransferase
MYCLFSLILRVKRELKESNKNKGVCFYNPTFWSDWSQSATNRCELIRKWYRPVHALSSVQVSDAFRILNTPTGQVVVIHLIWQRQSSLIHLMYSPIWLYPSRFDLSYYYMGIGAGLERAFVNHKRYTNSI